MFEDKSGRTVKCLDDAEAYILKFIVENLAQHDRRVTDKSQDFDLYLPWLMEIIENQRIQHEDCAPEIETLERLYMDAAWSLVMKGTLRPGPRTTSSDSAKGSYGKGYSLTLHGKAQLKDRILQRASEIKDQSSVA